MGAIESRLIDQALLQRSRQGDSVSLARDDGASVMTGRMVETRLREGLDLHGVDAHFAYGVHGAGAMPNGVRLVVMLEGEAVTRFGDDELMLGGETAGCVLLMAHEAHRFTRLVPRGGAYRQLVLTVSPEWIESAGLPELVAEAGRSARHFGPLSSRAWGTPQRVRQLASSMLEAPGEGDALVRLMQESRALELMAEALQAFKPRPDGISATARRRVACVLDALASGEDYTLVQLAKMAGSNPTTLQQDFRRTTGQTIAEYGRGMRLDRAREQLQRGQAISAVALDAGYSSQANFATAVRRRFGLTPRQLALGC
ncbi:helix-turn-helix transcriptional regulator [Chitinibacteraceae bacterium HSL-7]